MQAVILAGGKGTRLRDRLGDLPKPMVDFRGKPLLERQIELLRRHGIENVLLLLGYNPASISEYFGDGQKFGVRIEYLIEESPLGSGGAVLAAFEQLQDRFLVLYGDTILNVDLRHFLDQHARLGADASLFVHPNDHPQDSDLVEVGETGMISAFHPYPHDSAVSYPNVVNAALYVLEKRALQPWLHEEIPLDFGRDLFPRMVAAGQPLYAYRSREYIKDIGTPRRLERAEGDWQSGRIQASSFATPAPAVFLDRDGTINEEVNRVADPSRLKLLPGTGEAIRRLNRSGYVVVVVTNQPVIARGDCTLATLRQIHNKLETQLGLEGAYVDAIYFCPHHPDKGFPGERPELKFSCSCRKPAPGMIHTACKDLNLDLGKSWLIGDSETDIATAARAGVQSILVETGHAGTRPLTGPEPALRFPSLTEAAAFLADRSPQ